MAEFIEGFKIGWFFDHIPGLEELGFICGFMCSVLVAFLISWFLVLRRLK